VYMPVEKTAPLLAAHVTPVLVLPLTVAMNCWVWPACTETEAGDRVTVTAGVVAAWVPNKVQPASERVSSEKIADMQVCAHDFRMVCCL
jgi:hypothetical protein